MVDTGVIYVITNIVNGKQYVGQAVSYSSCGRQWGSWRRWQAHVKNANNGRCECRLLENAIVKYGCDSFTVEDVLECGIEELNSYEESYIVQYNTLVPNGYNLMTGGGNGRKHSVETRQLMSDTRSGKIHSQLTKNRIGDSNKGLIVDEQGRQNIGKASKLRNMSEDNKERLKNALDILGIDSLPMYIVLSVDKRYNRNIDTICVRVPQYKNRKFGKKDMSLSEKIRLAIEYKNSLT